MQLTSVKKPFVIGFDVFLSFEHKRYIASAFLLLVLAIIAKPFVTEVITPTKTEAQAPLLTYNFHGAHTGFKSLPLHRISELDHKEIESMILDSIPNLYRRKAAKYVKPALKLAQDYQVDPFWVLAIMWTESHFNTKAKSWVGAYGLMQIMPATGVYLVGKLKKDINEFNSTIPSANIEMGVYYLKNLLKRFGHNHVLATVAYNMGPGNVWKRLRYNRPVGVKNVYLDKVRRSYKYLTRGFKKYLAANHEPFTLTYVAAHNFRVTSDYKVLPGFEIDPMVMLAQK